MGCVVSLYFVIGLGVLVLSLCLDPDDDRDKFIRNISNAQPLEIVGFVIGIFIEILLWPIDIVVFGFTALHKKNHRG